MKYRQTMQLLWIFRAQSFMAQKGYMTINYYYYAHKIIGFVSEITLVYKYMYKGFETNMI
jgi:hypothetical protein